MLAALLLQNNLIKNEKIERNEKNTRVYIKCNDSKFKFQPNG